MLPGVIAPQVHFREPGLEHKEYLFTASCTRAKEGVTSFLEMPNIRPLTTTQAALDDKLQRSADHCLVNYGFFIGATAANLPDLIEAEPVCGIKIFMGSSFITHYLRAIRSTYSNRFTHCDNSNMTQSVYK